jgi:predicted transcriptional regulator
MNPGAGCHGWCSAAASNTKVFSSISIQNLLALRNETLLALNAEGGAESIDENAEGEAAALAARINFFTHAVVINRFR